MSRSRVSTTPQLQTAREPHYECMGDWLAREKEVVPSWTCRGLWGCWEGGPRTTPSHARRDAFNRAHGDVPQQ
jgi:hypothetical protein